MSDKELYESIKMGTLDIAFMVEEELNGASIEALKICAEPVSLYAKPDHALADKKIETKELADYHHLLWAMECCYSSAFNKRMQKAGIHSYSYMDFINTETIKQCTLAGLGIATLTDITVVKELEEQRLIKLDWDIGTDFYSFMLWNKFRADYPALRFFIERAKQYFSV